MMSRVVKGNQIGRVEDYRTWHSPDYVRLSHNGAEHIELNPSPRTNGKVTAQHDHF